MRNVKAYPNGILSIVANVVNPTNIGSEWLTGTIASNVDGQMRSASVTITI